MPHNRPTVAGDARARAAHTLADGKGITDRALLLRCADAIETLRGALEDIAAKAPTSGGIWARKRAEQALDEGPQ